MQVVCNKCRCPNQFGAVFCRNCGEKLPEQDMHHPDRKLQQNAKKVFMKLVKLIVTLMVIFILGALFLPWGFPSAPEFANQQEQETAQKKYEQMLKLVDSGEGIKTYTLSPAEAVYIANQFAASEVAKAAAEAAAAPAAQPSESEKDKANAAPAEPGKFVFWFDKKQNMTMAFSKKYFGFLPCRLELSGCFKLEAPEISGDAKEKPAAGVEPELKFVMTEARFGHIPIASFLFSQFQEMFKSMAYNKKIERGVSMVTDVRIKNQDEVFVVFK